MSSPTLQARRTALSLLLAVLLALALPGLNARADPAPTRIQTNVDADTTGHVRVQGLLLDGSGQGVGGGQLTASVAGQPLQTVTSGGDGAFAMEFNVPADKLSGPQDLVIAYAGDAQYAPTSQSSRIEFAGQSATAVTLEVEPASATPGDPVRVTGSVKAATGGPVSGALVNFSYDGAALSDYTLQTDANGNFDGYVEIPETAAVGEGKLVATFVGAAGLPAGSAEKQITIEAPAPASSPTPTEGESTQEAAPPPRAAVSAAGTTSRTDTQAAATRVARRHATDRRAAPGPGLWVSGARCREASVSSRCSRGGHAMAIPVEEGPPVRGLLHPGFRRGVAADRHRNGAASRGHPALPHRALGGDRL